MMTSLHVLIMLLTGEEFDRGNGPREYFSSSVSETLRLWPITIMRPTSSCVDFKTEIVLLPDLVFFFSRESKVFKLSLIFKHENVFHLIHLIAQ